MRWLAVLVCFPLLGQVNRVTFSGGWSRQLNGYFGETESATGLGMSYGYRPLRFLELEAGLTANFHPAAPECSAHGCVYLDDHFFWVPFGVRFVAPLAWKRVEVSGGGGGLYERYQVGNPDNPFDLLDRSGWGGYFRGGAAVWIDRGHHWWLGASPTFFLANPRYARDRWFVIAPEISFRWGRQ